MAIVLDSNQSGIFCNNLKEYSELQPLDLIIPPNVLAELLLWGNEPSLKMLYSLRPRVGLPLGEVVSQLIACNQDDILNFCPIFNSTTINYDLYNGLINALNCPLPWHKQWAKHWKTTNKKFCALMKIKAIEFRKELQNLKSKGTILNNPKVSSIDDSFNKFGNGSQSLVGMLVCNFLSNNGNQPKDTETLYSHVIANPYVCGFFKTILCYIISYSRMWNHDNNHLNFDPENDRDDWTDMTISLYTSPNDTILTDDKKLSNTLIAVYGRKNVIIKKATDLAL